MLNKSILSLVLGCLLWFTSLGLSPDAIALVRIKLSDITYHDCPAEIAEGNLTSDGSGRMANCFLVTGQAHNPTGKMVVDADVFGRIFDANGNPTLQNRGRVGTIREVPPGDSNFEIRISVADNQALPLKLEQFKASGFASDVRPFYYDNEDGEEF
ncbi:MAG: hypothetical protein HC796_07145 [Synechococcaceae cyanobacterium RL_1_2]|nr:hypothetical protein [Synechococcaceae cyanobacterium RL_1_2]